MNEQLANPYILAFIIAIPLFLSASSMALVAVRLGKLADAISKLSRDHEPVASNVSEIKTTTGRIDRAVVGLRGYGYPND